MVEVAQGIQGQSNVHLGEEVLDFETEGDGTVVITNKGSIELISSLFAGDCRQID